MRGNYEEVAEIVRYNMRPLVSSASQYSQGWNPLYQTSPKQPKPKDQGSNYAYELMYQLLTDKAFMKHVVTSNRLFIHEIVGSEYQPNEHSYNNDFANILYPNLVESPFVQS